MITGATGFQNFFPTLTGTLGYSDTVSLLLVAPPYIFMVFWSFGHSYMSDKLKNRYWFWMYPIPLVITGSLIFMFCDSFGPKYFSLFLLNFAFAMNGTVSVSSDCSKAEANLHRSMLGLHPRSLDLQPNVPLQWLS